MALDYAQKRRAVLKAIGGSSNIVSAAHCATTAPGHRRRRQRSTGQTR